ncbi:TIGR03617 family F420-dependent LLM class oxidoreductase [Amycolatopsis taiwanensis]|uniref:LLM class F420-dependent oxidoreductase n=1 Tax=Amycolatopsis taiwanensis TaxID=342230 RepID=A0A9W6VLA6_9PSEU|nr:TIGR03617 family F420-dependent LLM class oxidoreductase [Amycolatopsis taiwanensis]GLY70326.1 LLM class F420-dependent oxidoreductase [Amycolatopsis taiwanensis]
MKVYASLDPRLPLSEVPAHTRRLEALGFDGIHIPETIHDSLAVALLAVEHTNRITVRTSVTLAFVRSPTLVAYAAWDLAKLSNGRFELGLGSQIRQNIEGRFAMPWSEPTARMREYIEALRALFAAFESGDSVHFEGDTYRLTRLQPYFNPGPAECGAPPVFLGAVNRRMCEVAGEAAAGVITHSTNSDPAYLDEVVRPALRLGAERARRPDEPLIIAATTLATGGDDSAVAQAREKQRRLLAFLYTTPSYRPTLERHGWADLPERLRALVRAERWEELPAVLTDDVLDVVLTCGRYDQLPEIVLRRFGGVADGVVVPAPAGESDDPSLAAAIAAIQRGCQVA